LALVTFVGVVVLTLVPCVHADRGGFTLVRGERVSESGQKAIIAWNGTHEMLFLSTDLSSSKQSEVVEIMPLPSDPAISKGEKESFLAVQELVNTYLALKEPTWKYPYRQGNALGPPTPEFPKITITFQEAIGVHYLTVAKAEETGDLVQWLQNLLEDRGYSGELPPDLEGLVSYYMKNGVNFFVIDMIETNSTTRTIDPLVYEFASPKLYYPLHISTLFSGDTEISLFTMTNSELDDDSIVKEGFVEKAQFQIKHDALAEISSNITQLFSRDPYLCYFSLSASSTVFDRDILADFRSSIDISAVPLAVLSLTLGLGSLILFLPMNKIGLHSRIDSIPITKRLEIVLRVSGLSGTFLAAIGCLLLPWGLAAYGKNGEVLVAAFGPTAPILVILFVIPLLIGVPLCVYLLLLHRDSKEASLWLTAGGTYMIILMLVSCVYSMYTLDIGVYTFLAGCSFVVLAGLLSRWRIKLMPKEIASSERGSKFKTYVAKRVLISIEALIGISLVIFLLRYLLPLAPHTLILLFLSAW
jgi:hypothetical protein